MPTNAPNSYPNCCLVRQRPKLGLRLGPSPHSYDSRTHVGPMIGPWDHPELPDGPFWGSGSAPWRRRRSRGAPALARRARHHQRNPSPCAPAALPRGSGRRNPRAGRWPCRNPPATPLPFPCPLPCSCMARARTTAWSSTNWMQVESWLAMWPAEGRRSRSLPLTEAKRGGIAGTPEPTRSPCWSRTSSPSWPARESTPAGSPCSAYRWAASAPCSWPPSTGSPASAPSPR